MNKPTSIKIILNLADSPPPTREKTSSHKTCIEEQIRDAMCLCESDHASGTEWEFLRKIYNILSKKDKLGKRQKRILDDLHPFLMKHQSASGGHIDIQPEKVNLFSEGSIKPHGK